MDSSPAAWSPVLDDQRQARFSMVIIGDVRIEFRAQLSDRGFTELTEDHLSYTAAQALVSGTAVNLARHSVGVFHTIAVAGKIGDDAFTPVIRQSLRGLGVRDLLAVQPGMPNGFTMMLRDQPAAGRRGVRLLVADDTAPSRLFSVQDVRRHAQAIRDADVLFLDGYSLLFPVSRAALLAAARIARSSGTLVAFDLVPHDIYRRMGPADVRPVLEAADVIISAATTLARLVGRAPVRDSGGIRDLLPYADDAAGHGPLWLLRFGETEMEFVTAYQRGELLIEYPTGQGTNGACAGDGDRLAVSELYWWLSRRADR